MRGIVTKTMGPWTIHSNVGWSSLSDGNDQFLSSVALTYKVAPRWHALAEWDGATDLNSDTQDELSGLLIGLLWAPSERVAWDAAIRVGTTSADSNYALTIGLTFGF
jgi:hypothetical protein